MLSKQQLDLLVRTGVRPAAPSFLFPASGPKRGRAVIDLNDIEYEDIVRTGGNVTNAAQRAAQKISRVSFTALVERYNDDRVLEYVRFLVLKLVERDITSDHPTLSPSGPVDEMWHAHMLLPQEYAAMNALLFRDATKTFYHDPASAVAPDRRERYQRTLTSYQSNFGVEAPAAQWPRSELEGVAGGRNGNISNIINIKTLTGKTLSIELTPGMTVRALKIKIYEMDGIPVDQQRVIYAGRTLGTHTPAHIDLNGRVMRPESGNDDQELYLVYGVKGGDTLHLVLRLGGC